MLRPAKLQRWLLPGSHAAPLALAREPSTRFACSQALVPQALNPAAPQCNLAAWRQELGGPEDGSAAAAVTVDDGEQGAGGVGVLRGVLSAVKVAALQRKR